MTEVRWTRLTLNLRNAIRALHDRAERDRREVFLAEGINAAHAPMTPSMVILRSDASEPEVLQAAALEQRGAEVYVCSSRDMQVMTDAKTPQSILCVVPYFRERPLGDRVVVLDGVSDPGNVGTIIRTAAWFGWTDVVLGLGCADLYNPKVVRSTVGAMSTVNVLRGRDLVATVPTELANHRRIAAVPRGGHLPADILQTTHPIAIVIGSEAHGIAPNVLHHCDATTTIPGVGSVESLNAAIASAILCYEGRKLP